MVRIRLTLTGKKNQPSYRIVVIDSKKKRDAKYIENIGVYNPSTNPVLFSIKKDRYEFWIKKGAKPSESVLELIEGKYKFEKYNPKKNKDNGENSKEVKTEILETSPKEAEKIKEN